MPVVDTRSHSALSLCISLTLLGGCEGLWSGQTKSDPENCIVLPEVCPARQHCNQQTEACEWDYDAFDPEHPNVMPAAPVSFIFPGGMGGVVMQQTWPRDIKYQLAPQDTSAVVHYTIDGTVPAPGAAGTTSESAPALNATVLGGTTIRWFGDYGSAYAPEPIHVFTAVTNPTPPDTFGYIPEPVKFSNGKPVIEVLPGAQVDGTANVQLWSSTSTGYCPSCLVQWVVSVQQVGPVTCVDGVSAIGPYPGTTGTFPVSFRAPSQPGRYMVYSGLTLDYGCLGASANGPDLGMVIVK